MLTRPKKLTALALVLLCAGLFTTETWSRPAPQTISLRFARTKVTTVLSSLATEVGFDLVIAPGVEGESDINLTDVDWSTALDAIAAANGLRYYWNDDVLVISSASDQTAIPMAHRVVSLRHADPLAVQTVLAGVLTEGASVNVLGGVAPTGTTVASGSTGQSSRPILVVTEKQARMQAVLDLIDSLDTPRPQFEIAVKFIETSLDDQQGVGLSWPTRIGATVADFDAVQSTTTGGGQTRTPPSAEYPIPDGKIWNFGTLSVDQFSGFIEFLDQNGKSHLLSDPRVTVLEDETAEIRVTTTFPVQTVTRFTEGAATQDIVDFIDIEVGITLKVRPRLNDSGLVTLFVEPIVQEITGFSGPTDNQRPITANRRVTTSVRVADNETLVIGGLMRETDFTTKSKVFLLGDIPILGALFTHRKTQKQKTDLLIFITPRILSAGSS